MNPLQAKKPEPKSQDLEDLEDQARRLGLWGVLEHLSELSDQPWLTKLLGYEQAARQRRSLERRIQACRIGRFKAMADFDWHWPKKLAREAVEDLFRLEFLKESANVILVGSNGLGKTMIAKNLAHQAVLRGHTARFVTASELLSDLAAQEVGTSLNRRLARYIYPDLLAIDEVGYLSASARHADLLFEVVTRRYQHKSIVLTTNKPFSEWNEVFPSSACVVALIDRLVHRSEIIAIEGESYRLKEATERAESKKKITRKSK